MIDLQNHTVASDGEDTPESLVDTALSKGLKAIAITDHDSVASVLKAVEYAKDKDIEVVPGIELSCDDPLFDNSKIDVLGLLIDVGDKGIKDIVEHINRVRDDHKRKIIERLQELEYDISYDEVKATVTGTFGRPHIAKMLLKKYPDKFESVADVFDQLIGKGKPAFLDIKGRVSIEEGIKIIQNAGGVAILAHPGVYPRDVSVKLIDYFVEKGGDGIETYYPYHIICRGLELDEEGNNEMISFYKDIAKSKGILESGGNDHHGKFRATMGAVEVPDSVLQNLRDRKRVE